MEENSREIFNIFDHAENKTQICIKNIEMKWQMICWKMFAARKSSQYRKNSQINQNKNLQRKIYKGHKSN